eukprot:gene12434-3101_t
MPAYFQKPENALKRANEFVEVGTKEAALDVLYEVIKSKKHRNWQKIHEPILKLYLTLCVQLKRSVSAKEGLYQYKLICQQVNIASLEDVVRFFLKLAEDTAENARQQSREQVIVDDLDQVQTPEGLLLSSVSVEDTQDRTDRVLLTPWVKFLWEAYRNVLDLLRNNNRVERLYQDTAQQAFKFCLRYNRRTEFRKLCDHIRNHLTQIQKYQGQPNAINLNNTESLQMHVETRLSQLESAIQMELWQEAFKAIEDIHGLMQLSKKPPKPHVLANYYEKMALVFWKAGNCQFHAATLHRLYVLYKEQKKSISQEETQKISSKVLLATLAVPISAGRSELEGYLNHDDTAHEKAKRLSGLLGLQTIPSRQYLIKEMLKVNVIPNVIPEIANLYQWIEVDFQPLKICQKVDGVLNTLKDLDDYQQYVKPLMDIAATRMLRQVSQVYDRMQFSKLASLVPFFDEHKLERIIVDTVKEKELQLSIDHRKQYVNFGSTMVVAMREDVPEGPFIQSLPSELTRSQLFQLSQGLQDCFTYICPDMIKRNRQQEREHLIQQYLRQERKEHAHILSRKFVIEARKEMIENIRTKQERKEQARIQEQQQKLKAAEERRLEEERAKREEERMKQEYAKVKKQQVLERVKTLTESDVGKKAFKGLTSEQIEDMNEDDIIRIQVEQLDKEKRELSLKMKTQEKRIDYMARAMRREEIPLLEKKYEEDSVKDKIFWEQQEEEMIATAEKEHEIALKTKNRLGRMIKDKDEFVNDLEKKRADVFEARLKDFEDRLETLRKERLEARRKQRIEERKRNYIEEKREAARKAEEERILREKEEEKKRLAMELEAKRKEEEERERKLADIERKKLEKEREIEEKIRRMEQEDREPPIRNVDAAKVDPRDARDGQRRPRDGEDSGTWRRPEATTPSRDTGREAPPAREASSGTGRKYIPPSMRARMNAGEAAPEGDMSRDGDRSRDFRDSGRSRDFDRDSGRSRDFDRDGGRARDFDRDGGRPREFDRDGGRPREFDRDGGRPRDFDRDGGRPRDFDRDGGRPRDFTRDSDRGDSRRERGFGGGWRGDGDSSGWRRDEAPRDKTEGQYLITPW